MYSPMVFMWNISKGKDSLKRERRARFFLTLKLLKDQRDQISFYSKRYLQLKKFDLFILSRSKSEMTLIN